MKKKYPLGFESGFRDHNNRMPGEPGFVPPLPTGYTPYYGYKGEPLDPQYKDAAGRTMHMAGFIPPAPCYNMHYIDDKGHSPGTAGFVPPLAGIDDPELMERKAMGLAKGYDDEYRDSEGRAPGMPGFVPPCYDDRCPFRSACVRGPLIPPPPCA